MSLVRITPTFFLRQTIRTVQTYYGRITELQIQASTGMKVRKPSDSPAEHALGQFLAADIGRIDAHLENLEEARTTLNLTVDTLRDVADVLRAARETILQANQGTVDRAQYETLADRIDTLMGRLLDLANTRVRGRYLFSGTALDQQPFVVTETDTEGRPLKVEYRGSNVGLEFVVGLGRTVSAMPPGETVFMPRDSGTAVYMGNTGAKPGQGTDSATGRTVLEVKHTATTYAPGSGVAPGASSADGDTILGPTGANVLTVVDTSGTGTAGTVSLNGGPAISWTNADTDLRVEGPNGEVVYVDMSAITPGFSGNVDITADGTLSIDGGATTVPITFSNNQTVTDSATGEVIFVDTTEVRRTGTELIDHQGRYDLFQLLRTVADDLRAAAGRTPSENAQLFGRAVAELDRLYNRVLETIGEQSSLLELLDGARNRAEQTRVELERLRQEAVAADISEVVLKLKAEEASLQLTLAATARLLNVSLLNFVQ